MSRTGCSGGPSVTQSYFYVIRLLELDLRVCVVLLVATTSTTDLARSSTVYCQIQVLGRILVC